MSSYVGVDLSTRAVDLVKLDEDTDRAEWVRVPLVGKDAVERARSYRTKSPGDWIGEPGSLKWTRRIPIEWWDDVLVVAIEDPAGRGDMRKLARVQGVVLATIPARIPVWLFQPGEWRKLCGMSGNASKYDVASWVYGTILHRGDASPDRTTWPQDARDACAIAYACRALNETQEADGCGG